MRSRPFQWYVNRIAVIEASRPFLVMSRIPDDCIVEARFRREPDANALLWHLEGLWGSDVELAEVMIFDTREVGCPTW